MPILEAFVISRTLLWRGLIELMLAWLPLIIHALHSKLGPRSGKRDLASSLNLDSCQLAPLPKEVIKYGQLILVSQYLLFPSWFFFPHSFSFPTLSLSTLPLSIFPAHHPSLHGSSFTSGVFEQGVGRGRIVSWGWRLTVAKQQREVSTCSLCLHPSCFQSRRGTAAGNISQICLLKVLYGFPVTCQL